MFRVSTKAGESHAPSDTVFQTGQGRGMKLAKAYSTPVGSVRFLSARFTASPIYRSRIPPLAPPSPLVCLSPDTSGPCSLIAESTPSVSHASQPPKHLSLRAKVAKQPLCCRHGLSVPETCADDDQVLIIFTSPRHGQGSPPSSVPAGFLNGCVKEPAHVLPVA